MQKMSMRSGLATKGRKPTASGPPARHIPEPGGQEIEIKFALDPALIQQVKDWPLLASGSAGKASRLRTIYYDTRAAALASNGITLRVRAVPGMPNIMTAKSELPVNGNPFRRKQVEVAIESLRPDIPKFDESTANSLALILGRAPLVAKFETQVVRWTTVVRHEHASIELAVDEGRVSAGRIHAPLCEVELELISGSEKSLCSFARRFAESFPCRLDFASKSQKGFRVRREGKLAAVKAGAIALHDDASVDDAIAMVLSNTLAHFAANWVALRETASADSIHQLRVALRRMRSGLAMFARIAPCEEFSAFGAEAKRIASALGPARAYDVVAAAAALGVVSGELGPGASEKLLAAISDRRASACQDARALIDDRRTTLFVLELRHFLAGHGWRGSLPSTALSKLAAPARKFARRTLDRLFRRALKRGEGLAGLSAEARHELRISLKSLRYAAEFFVGLSGGHGKRKRFGAAVAELQDLLGRQNDLVSARQLLGQLATCLEPEARPAADLLVGAGASENEEEDVLLRVWEDFKSIPACWR